MTLARFLAQADSAPFAGTGAGALGTRPTFDDDRISIETFLLEPLTGASPERIRVEFLWRVRDERKFPTPADLKAQILRDVAVAQKYFQRVKP